MVNLSEVESHDLIQELKNRGYYGVNSLFKVSENIVEETITSINQMRNESNMITLPDELKKSIFDKIFNQEINESFGNIEEKMNYLKKINHLRQLIIDVNEELVQ